MRRTDGVSRRRLRHEHNAQTPAKRAFRGVCPRTSVSAKNAETGAAIPVSGGKAHFRLAKHDIALVELK